MLENISNGHVKTNVRVLIINATFTPRLLKTNKHFNIGCYNRCQLHILGLSWHWDMEIYSEAVLLIGLLQDEWWSVSQPITVQATHPSLSTSDRKLASCLQTTPHAYIGHYGPNKTVFSAGANLHWLSWTIHLCCQSFSTFTTHLCCDISRLERQQAAEPSPVMIMLLVKTLSFHWISLMPGHGFK